MKIGELKKESSVIEWFNIINPTINTIRTYLNALQAYTEFTGKTPEELIDEAEQEISDGILPRKRKIKRYIIDFRKHLQENGLADKSVQGYMEVLEAFMRRSISIYQNCCRHYYINVCEAEIKVICKILSKFRLECY